MKRLQSPSSSQNSQRSRGGFLRAVHKVAAALFCAVLAFSLGLGEAKAGIGSTDWRQGFIIGKIIASQPANPCAGVAVSANFQTATYCLNGASVPLSSILTVTRTNSTYCAYSYGAQFTAAANSPCITDVGLYSSSSRSNLFTNSTQLATQNVSTAATSYTASFWGNGSITFSGTCSGTLTGTGASTRVSLTFTATSGTCTATVAGTVKYAQMVTGGQPLQWCNGSCNADSITLTTAAVAAFANSWTAQISASSISSTAPSALLGFDSTAAPAYNLANGIIDFVASSNLQANNSYSPAWGRTIVVSQSGSGRTIVVNGGTEASDSTTVAAPATVYIGRRGSGNYLDGVVSSFTVWNSQLSQAQRLSLSSRTFNFRPYASNSAILAAYGQAIAAGSVLSYEYTQPWTMLAGLPATFGSPPSGAGVIESNVVSGADAGYEIWIDNNCWPRVRLIHNIANSYIDVAYEVSICDGKRHVLGATYDGSGVAAGVKFYLDGNAVTNTTLSDSLAGQTITTAPQNFTVGSQQLAPSFFFPGVISYYQLSSVARSASYMAAYTDPSSPPAVDANTALSYNFNEGSGTTTSDGSGHGYTGTLTATSLWLPQ